MERIRRPTSPMPISANESPVTLKTSILNELPLLNEATANDVQLDDQFHSSSPTSYPSTLESTTGSLTSSATGYTRGPPFKDSMHTM
ncbi:hypothetical protein HBI56_146590 [Parastagonospora nodorum]|nr:hypothetical protein HBH53_049860 [Parastagonospora nodorum]KAH3981810.1 hypothetical protein HBH51_045150 [Parastagonospora nodorum]KAH3982861.1 hypothetical protein HBH52_072750 [Parastagonospora nodorum]KAH3995706.1 hypothetical protein HBI10_167450 [Parastagonospora nodorum]KAH4015684.1 hypothetical protein HBI13_157040 [Parastagonospora nodorum]